MSDQFEKFITYDNFCLSLKRLQTVKRDLYKDLYIQDLRHFAYFENENIELLIHNIREGKYEPSSTYKIMIPKKKNLVRPISVLGFVDLLVFQAITNIIADVFFDNFKVYQSRIIFGNLYRKSSDKNPEFFYEKWQTQWKKYNEITEQNYNSGYEYFSDFDIASFYDTIDHGILADILATGGVETDIVDFLDCCLKKWTIGSFLNKYAYTRGIPQGPQCSLFYANAYLLPLDIEITNINGLDIKYLRYVDDIRILSKTEIEGQKAITYLDLISREFGLIPQSEKIGIKHIGSIKKELNKVDRKFSDINKEYARENSSLKESTHRKLKKQFLKTFNRVNETGEVNEEYLNKTIISFSLFKLNKDDEIKDSILEHIELLNVNIEGVLYYFKKYYVNDILFLEWINKTIESEVILFHHNVALVFKEFPMIGYSDEIFEKHFENNKRFWLIKYYMLDWLVENNKYDLINSLERQGNLFVDRK